MRKITVAATQMKCSHNIEENINNAEKLIRYASYQNAKIILMQELFYLPYFCIDKNKKYFSLARKMNNSFIIKYFSSLAKELRIVLPISYFEVDNYNNYYNSIVVINSNGKICGFYRKTHIPNSPGYYEKFFFTPGNTGFKVFKTSYAKIGIGICWDQWFPETSRCLALQNAELLFYPTAIGSEPNNDKINSKNHWINVQIGQAAANMIPIIVSNRIGTENSKIFNNFKIKFYGTSFITSETGLILSKGNDKDESVLIYTFNLNEINKKRKSWGLFHDRRPNIYKIISKNINEKK